MSLPWCRGLGALDWHEGGNRVALARRGPGAVRALRQRSSCRSVLTYCCSKHPAVAATTSTPRKEQARTAIPSQTWQSLDVWFDSRGSTQRRVNNADYTPEQTERQALPARPECGSAAPATRSTAEPEA